MYQLPITMPWSSQHTKWLEEKSHTLTTSDGKPVKIYEFKPDLTDTGVLSAWARHFRNHYSFDSEIDDLRSQMGLTRKDYLLNIKLPSLSGFGPGVRSGDFGEILVADYLEYILGYQIPRTRYGTKVIRDESSKGSDLIGFKLYDENVSNNDILAVFEVKAQLSKGKTKPRLGDAVSDSAKDNIRIAESLNAMYQRYYDKGETDQMKLVGRFQNPTDRPYTRNYAAAALFCNSAYSDDAITSVSTSAHPYKDSLSLVVIKADNFMSIVHKLFYLAADEA